MTRAGTQWKLISGLEVELTRKPIKNYYLRVVPPDGTVRMSVPLRARNVDITAMIDERLGWIAQRRIEILTAPPAPAARVVRSGEIAELWGIERQLRVVEASVRPFVRVHGDEVIEMSVPVGANREQRVRQLREFYRRELKVAAQPLVDYWSLVMEVDLNEWRTKKMSTRWGTCNVDARRMWLSLDLARRSPECLESVVVHELTHLLEGGHTARFWALMDRFHPAWRHAEQELRHNPAPRIE